MTDSPMRVAVIGAGLSGLVAARELQAAGADVIVLDKGRSVGGRLATRRIGGARLDHGAQFFTVRTPAFQRRVDDWTARGLVHVWSHGFGHGSLDGAGITGSDDAAAGGDGYPRYVATGGMNSLAKDLAEGLRIETSTMVFGVREGESTRWDVVIDDGTKRPVDAVILTAPLPQSFSMLVDMVWTDANADGDSNGNGDTDDSPAPPHGVELDEALFRTEYDRTIGLLCTVDGPTAIPEPGGVQQADAVFSFIGDNQRKGVSSEPAVTFHASPEWSEEHWDHELPQLQQLLTEAAAPWLGDAHVLEAQVKKWRLATPRAIWPDPCWSTAGGSIVVAGDAFAGPRVEGAHNSGLAAAHHLLT